MVCTAAAVSYNTHLVLDAAFLAFNDDQGRNSLIGNVFDDFSAKKIELPS